MIPIQPGISARNPTRSIRIGSIRIGGDAPIAVQSMCATHTRDVDATAEQVEALRAAGADVIRIAVDSKHDVAALARIRAGTEANLSVDLQENYRLVEQVAQHVDKVRYNPGHLYHHERKRPWQDKVRWIADIAGSHGCALRIGVNAGSVDPALAEKFEASDSLSPMLASAMAHCELLDSIGFLDFCVSLKDSDPAKVLQLNRRFAAERPDVPLHLGVTEAGMPPEAITKTRRALEPLLHQGIGDTLRVSLTLPNARKHEEIAAGRQILENVRSGQIITEKPRTTPALNIVSCPSCSRVENEQFIELAQDVRELTRYAANHAVTIAVMGCRVNGPGETDDADIGLWCGPRYVNLKRKGEHLGAYPYSEILSHVRGELDRLIAARGSRQAD